MTNVETELCIKNATEITLLFKAYNGIVLWVPPKTSRKGAERNGRAKNTKSKRCISSKITHYLRLFCLTRFLKQNASPSGGELKID